MKLLRFGEFENEKPAVELSNGKRIDVSAFGEDFNEAFLLLMDYIVSQNG
jgi:hypothetical protein